MKSLALHERPSMVQWNVRKGSFLCTVMEYYIKYPPRGLTNLKKYYHLTKILIIKGRKSLNNFCISFPLFSSVIIDITYTYEWDEKNPVDSLVLINVICIAYKVENILKVIIQMFAHLIAYITIFTCPSIGICSLDFFVQKA